jgi:hypothetical protein
VRIQIRDFPTASAHLMTKKAGGGSRQGEIPGSRNRADSGTNANVLDTPQNAYIRFYTWEISF